MRAWRSHGVTLIELLLVVSILGIVALVAIPFLSHGGAKRLDVATAEVVTAIRYARSEAIRTGKVHGVEINSELQRVSVYKADITTDPVSKAALLIHPVDRKPYVMDFDTAAMVAGVRIDNEDDVFRFPGKSSSNLLFSPSGMPGIINKLDDSALPLLEGLVRLTYDKQQRTVRVAINGRVSLE